MGRSGENRPVLNVEGRSLPKNCIPAPGIALAGLPGMNLLGVTTAIPILILCSMLAACPSTDGINGFDGAGRSGAGSPTRPNIRRDWSVPVAAGGSDVFLIHDNSAQDLQIAITGGFEAKELDSVPPLARELSVTAPRLATAAEVRLTSSNWGDVSEYFEVKALFDVTLSSADGRANVPGQALLIPATDPRIIVGLRDDLVTGPEPGDLGFLIDRSLRTTSEGVEQLSWNTFALPAVRGEYAVDFVSGAVGEIRFEVEVY